MLRPRAITVAGYRSFARPTRLELRPLTLLCGRNNAGKSALVRLLPIIADSVAESARSPFDLTGPAGRRASFASARYSGSLSEGDSPGLSLSFDWSEHGRIAEIGYSLDFSSDDNLTYVRELSLHDAAGSCIFEAKAYPPYREGQYEVSEGKAPETKARIPFVGLLPPADGDFPILTEVHRLMSSLRGIQWLQAMRAQPLRFIEASGASPRRLGPGGESALDVLLTNSDMQQEVADWYLSATDRSFALKQYAKSYRPFLNLKKLNFDVELADTGEGMSQVLPVLVAAAMVRRHASGWPWLLAVEEPQSQLHPDAQRALAEHLCVMASQSQPPIIVLETHSNALMLAVQLAIAKGQIPPDRVCAYWIDLMEDGTSLARAAEFDPQGRPDGKWPPNIFEDERKLAGELVACQLGVLP
jgi:hypothetical protein